MEKVDSWFNVGVRAALAGVFANYGELLVALALAHVSVADRDGLWRGWQEGKRQKGEAEDGVYGDQER